MYNAMHRTMRLLEPLLQLTIIALAQFGVQLPGRFGLDVMSYPDHVSLSGSKRGPIV